MPKIKNSWITSFAVFCALMRKDLYLLTKSLFSLLLDCMAPLAAQVITFGFLFPIMGMPSAIIAPIYLGSMMSIFLQMGFSHVVRVGFDLTENRFIDYQLTIPLHKSWLFAQHIIYLTVETMITMVPLFTLGIFILRDHFNLAAINWLSVLFIFTLICLFFASLFTALSYVATFKWNLDNAWPRILIPLLTFSSAFSIWQKVNTFSPMLAKIMLLSPFTYVAEGMRAALLPDNGYLPVSLCAGALLFFICINCSVLWYGVTKRLDPV